MLVISENIKTNKRRHCYFCVQVYLLPFFQYRFNKEVSGEQKEKKKKTEQVMSL